MDNPAVQGVHAFGGQHLTPTPGRQAAVLATLVLLGASVPQMTAATGVSALQQVRKGASLYRNIVGPVTSLMSAYSTVDAFTKIRGGGHKPAFAVDYEPWDPMWVPPFPYLGQIPLIRPRLEIGTEPYEQTLSRAREDTVHTSRVPGPVRTPKSMGGPSAQPRRKPSRNKPVRRIPLADRRGPAISRERRHRTPEEEYLDKYYTRRR